MEIISQSVKETLDIGRKIASNLQKGDIICLFGQLGAGKTLLTKGVAQGLGLRKNTVISPSFVLIRQYTRAKIPLYHFDLYRLQTPEDILVLGYEEYLYGDGICVVEWADRMKYLLPAEYLKIELFIRGDKKRLLKFNASGKRAQELVSKIHENISH